MSETNLKKISPLSHSKTSAFVNCQRKFSFSYLEGIKEPSSIHAAVGTFVHSVIEEYFKHEDNPNPYFNWIQNFNYLEDTYLKLWSKSGKYLMSLYEQQESKVNNSFSSVEEWTKQLVLNYIELEDWIQLESDIEGLKFDSKAVTVGELGIQNEKYVKKELVSNKDSFILRGYIDRLQAGKLGKKIIIDIKTGKPPSSLDKEKADQIKSYALMYGHQEIDAGYVYFLGEKNITPEKRIIEVPIEDIDKNEEFYTKSYDGMIINAQLDSVNYSKGLYRDVWKPKINHFCNWCWYKNGCPEWVNVYQDKKTSIALDSINSKLRHQGGLSKLSKLSKQDEINTKKISSAYYELNKLDLQLQNKLTDLQNTHLEELQNTSMAIADKHKENSNSIKALHKLKKLINDIGLQSFVSQNKNLLDKYVLPSQNKIISIDLNMQEKEIWQNITNILNNIQHEELVSQLGDFKADFLSVINELRRDWMLWHDFTEINKFKDIDILNVLSRLKEFQLFRGKKISLLKKKSFEVFLNECLIKMRQVKKLTIDDLAFLQSSKKHYLKNLHLLAECISVTLSEIIEIQNKIQKTLDKLVSIDKDLL